MCSPDLTARDRVLAELAALGPSPADACRPGGVEAVELLGQAVGPLGRRGIPGLDPGALRRLGQELLYRADPDAVEERERKRFERRHLSFGFTMENTGTISGACGDTLSWEIIKTAVHAFGPPLGSEDSRTAAQRRMDGLTAACQAALDSGTAGTRHGAAPHLSVLVEEQTLAGAASGQARETEGCDADGAGGTANGQAGSCCGTDRYGDRRWDRDRAGGQTGAANGQAGAANGQAGAASGQPGTGPDGGKDPASGTKGCCGSMRGGTAGCCGSMRGGTAGCCGSMRGGTAAPLGPPPARTGFGATLTARQILALACHAELSIIRYARHTKPATNGATR